MGDQQSSTVEQHDERSHWRCPQLGGAVTFRYCRKLTNGMPCAQVALCWEGVFDVEAFLASHYDRDQLAAAWNRPRPDKVVELIDLIARTARDKTDP